MHMKTSSKYVFLTYYIYFSSFLPFILLISWYRWRSCANCALSERIAHFFHSSLSLSLSLSSLLIGPRSLFSVHIQSLPFTIHNLSVIMSSSETTSCYKCKGCGRFYQNESSFRKHFTYSKSCKRVKPLSSLVAVDSVAAPASSQFGAPPFLPDGPLSLRSSPKPSGIVEDCDNFDSSLLPPDDFHMASNDDTYSFDHPYVDDLSSTLLPIEHHPDFSNVGAHLELGKESESTIGSNNDDDDDDDDNDDDDGIHHGEHDNPFSSSLFHADDSPAGSSAFSGFVQPEVPYDVRVINDSQLQPADEALLSLIIDNNLPQEMYNKILDWAYFCDYA